MEQIITEKIELNGRTLKIETGEVAKQAGGAVVVTYGETVILASCCLAKDERNLGFFPLTVDYRERTYAAGKIPGGFFKREGRPQEKEIITSRLIDRPLRPLFPDGYTDEVQIMITVLSSDGENDADIPAMIGASCATVISGAPFDGPVGAVRIGKVDGKFIVNPTFQELEQSQLDFVISGKEDSIVMLEGEALEVPENDIVEAIEAARAAINDTIALQKKIIEKAGKDKIEFEAPEKDTELEDKVTAFAEPRIADTFRSPTSKKERSEAVRGIIAAAETEFAPEDDEEIKPLISDIVKSVSKKVLRKLVKDENIRVDGRAPEQIRPISCRAGVLPRTHGSGLYTKGETQSLCAVTLGTTSDQQIMDELEGEYKKSFMLHYNFPPFSVGEVRPNRGPGRREIGHGLLAEKAIAPVLESSEEFPYTIRLVSDILESNGSSSMATVCAGSIALMDAGIQIKAPVAGVGMGIIDGIILSDMLGDEDHAGDMDFKVAGTRQGITAIQMDIKISGISKDVLSRALDQAKKARVETLDEIAKVIAEPREKLSPYAPSLSSIKINPNKIGLLIGPGGKNIKEIQETTDTDINIDDDGTVVISGSSAEKVEAAVKRVEEFTKDVEVGQVYDGKVKNILDFGAFVEVLPGKEGLVHISELAPYRVAKVTDVLNVGDAVRVKCIKIDDRGRINLSRVEAMTEEEKAREKLANRKES